MAKCDKNSPAFTAASELAVYLQNRRAKIEIGNLAKGEGTQDSTEVLTEILLKVTNLRSETAKKAREVQVFTRDDKTYYRGSHDAQLEKRRVPNPDKERPFKENLKLVPVRDIATNVRRAIENLAIKHNVDFTVSINTAGGGKIFENELPPECTEYGNNDYSEAAKTTPNKHRGYAGQLNIHFVEKKEVAA